MKTKTAFVIAPLIVVALFSATPASAEPACTTPAGWTADVTTTLAEATSCIRELADEVNLLGPAIGLEAEIDAPNYVYAGNPFTVFAEARLTGLGASIVQVLIVPVAGPCALTEFRITGGIPLSTDQFLLTSAVSLDPQVDHGDPPEPLNSVNVHTTWDTAQDVTGLCEPTVQIVELVDAIAGKSPLPLKALVPVLEMPATPIVLGKITTKGGNDVDDEAVVTIPATPPPPAAIPILVLTSDPKVALTGAITHTEVGPTVDDEGYFEIRHSGTTIQHVTLTGNGDSKELQAERSLPHKKGETIRSTFCLYGVYIDDGAYVDQEGPAETCVHVDAEELEDPRANIVLMAEACLAFALPTTQLDLLRFGIALAPQPSPASAIVLDGAIQVEALVGYFMFDQGFGSNCL